MHMTQQNQDWNRNTGAGGQKQGGMGPGGEHQKPPSESDRSKGGERPGDRQGQNPQQGGQNPQHGGQNPQPGRNPQGGQHGQDR
jgi:hypothetical protein